MVPTGDNDAEGELHDFRKLRLSRIVGLEVQILKLTRKGEGDVRLRSTGEREREGGEGGGREETVAEILALFLTHHCCPIGME